ncbi:uncharacterized protein BDV17DRAFT_175014 [Aspergillus undulatus]|uniref:uncharacterized protein n=1 Tax=Aspergillus undulatus TaxID=1810928 RepID=UPI003CCDC34D
MQQPLKSPESDYGTTLSRSRSRSRSASISSDSQLSLMHLAPPSVNPPPSFIVPASASQIITSDQEFNTADFVADEEDDSGALVTADALSVLNGFLDYLLLNILAAAKSTQLASIRPAVADVLKPRLANLVVSVADEELSEYLGETEDEETEFRGGQMPNGEFDLIRTWKLTRLRCMVYTRLGDMEEDDEEEYIAQEGLVDDEGAPRRFTNHIGNITPAAAIFLTSIIEHIGEQALIIAGETARSRLAPKLVVEQYDDEDEVKERSSMNRLVVEELDIEKLALNPTLGRLWRTWRKRTRTPNLSRLASRDSLRRHGTLGLHSRKSSFSVADDSQSPLSPPLEEPNSETQSDIDPISVPLPMGKNDIQEIENADDVETGEFQTMQAVVAHKVRPQSLMVLTLQSPRTPSSNASSPATPVGRSVPPPRHARSRSLPAAACPSESLEIDQTESADSAARKPSSASEERRRLETMYEHEEREEREEGEEREEAERFEKAQENKAQKIESSSTELSQSEPQPKLVSAAPEDISSDVKIEDTAQEKNVPSHIANSPANGAQSSTFLIEPDTIIEGQGTAERPSLSSVQRPKRKSSGDVARRDRQLASSTPSPSEQGLESVVSPQEKQIEEDVPDQPIAVAITTSTAEPAATPNREVRPSMESTRGSRPPSNSGDSTRSSFSRPYHRPSPLNLTSGSQRSATSSISSSATERAGVQRIQARPSTSATSSPHPSTLAKPRRSGSFSSNREKRPMTANSSTGSQVSTKLKGLINRPNEAASQRPRRDSETSRRSGGTGDSSDDKSGLDELIRSEETLHFTLTPKSVREMDFPDAPKWKAQRSNTSDMAEDASRSRASTRTPTTMSSQPSPKTRAPEAAKPKPNPAPIQAPRAPSSQKSKPGMARDARPGNDSLSDFAEFIRNSGPASPPIAKSPGRESSDTAELTKRTSRAPSRAESALSNSTRGPRAQARSAAPPKSEANSTSDLIDFIREGPPTAGARRISRTVAPFRSTMDSEDMAYEHGTPSVTSTQGESTATKSQASVGSRTGLLDSSAKKVKSAPSKPQPSSIAVDDDPLPKRTRRRVPDPYDLDWDDEEFEAMLEEEEKPKPKREEESLIDFLRNVPPPPSEPEVQPLSVNSQRTRTPTGGTSSMKARLLRNTSSEKNSVPKVPSAKPSQISLRQQSDQYSRRPSNYTTKSNSERNNTDAMYGLSSVSERQTETSALADFLRNTGPPEPPRPPPRDSSFSRFFVRRKKVEA